jgi:type II secretory pathway pseudopilin PulG
MDGRTQACVLSPPRDFAQVAVDTGVKFGYTICMMASRRNQRCHADTLRRIRHTPASVQSAFSLIELLITLATLIVLTTMYWGFSAGSHQRQQQKACQANLAKSYISLTIYAGDHGGKFPDVAGARTSEQALDVLVPRYTVDTASFICPGSKDSPLPAGESFLKRRISYAYYMGRQAADAQEVLMSDKQIDTQPKSIGQYVFSSTGKPPGNNHHKYGGNFLFCDGRLELAPARAPFSLVLTQGVVLLNPKP